LGLIVRAVVLDGYNGLASLRLAELPRPTLKPGDVLIRVHAASLNPIDVKFTTGQLKQRFELTFPHVLGRDCSGVIAAIGKDVKDFKVGDQVYAVGDSLRWGTHAEEATIDAATVALKPQGLDHRSAAALPLAGLSALAGLVTVGGVKKGDRVLIHGGAGGVGSLAIQLAKYLGARVATTARSSSADFVRGFGADVIIDHSQSDFSDGLRDYDVVFDTVGGDVRYRSFRVLRPGGLLVHLSTPPMTQPAPRADVTVKQAMVSYATSHLNELTALVDSGAIRPVVERIFSFGDAVNAYDAMRQGHIKGKIVIDFNSQN